MEMPISEIIDRYTIALLKRDRTCENVEDEINAYYLEINKYRDCEPFVKKLMSANATIWDLETKAGRSNVDTGNISLEEIGRIAMEVRHWNKIRNGIKAEIVDKYNQGFKEIKVNYTKHDYGVDIGKP